MSGDLELKLRITADGKAAVTNLHRVDDALEGLGDEAETASLKVGKLAVGALSLNELAEAAGRLGDVVERITGLADAYRSLQARIANATGSEEAAASAMEEIGRIAQDTHAPLQATGELFARLAQATKGTGVAQEELLRFTRAVNDAMRVSGTSATEAAGALTQLSQALASGTLRGDEFNSVNEQMPAIIDAIAAHLGDTRGELRALAEQGKLTSDVVRASVLEMSGDWAKAAADMPVTLQQALTDLESQWQAYLGQNEAVIGATNALGQAIRAVGDHLGEIASAGGLAALTGMIATLRKTAAAWVEQTAQIRRATAAEQEAIQAALEKARAEERAAMAARASAAATLEAARAAEAEALAQRQAAREVMLYGEQRAAIERQVTTATNARIQAEERLAATEKALAAQQGAVTAAAGALGRLGPVMTAAGRAAKFLGGALSTVGWTAVAYEVGELVTNLVALHDQLAKVHELEAGLGPGAQAVADRLAEISRQTGITVTSMADLNAKVADGILVFDRAANTWRGTGKEISAAGQVWVTSVERMIQGGADFGQTLELVRQAAQTLSGTDLPHLAAAIRDAFDAKHITQGEMTLALDAIREAQDRTSAAAKSAGDAADAQRRTFAHLAEEIGRGTTSFTDLERRLVAARNAGELTAAQFEGLQKALFATRKAADDAAQGLSGLIESARGLPDLWGALDQARQAMAAGRLSAEEYGRTLDDITASIDKFVGAEERKMLADQKAAAADREAAKAAQETAQATEEAAQAQRSANQEWTVATDLTAVVRQRYADLSDAAAEYFDRQMAAVRSIKEWWTVLSDKEFERVKAQFEDQKRSVDALARRIENGTASAVEMQMALQNLERGAYDADRTVGLLGAEQLSGLRAAAEDAKRRMQSLEDAAKSALERYQDLRDQQSGDEVAIAERRKARELADLQAQLDEARRAADAQAIADLEEAISLARKYHDQEIQSLKERLAGEQAITAERQKRTKIQPGNATGGPLEVTHPPPDNTGQTTYPARPGPDVPAAPNGQIMTLRLQAPDGKQADLATDEHTASEVLDVLKRAGLTSTRDY